MVPRYEIIAVLVAILAAIALAAFVDGTYINAVIFGRCELDLLPPACRSVPYPVSI